MTSEKEPCPATRQKAEDGEFAAYKNEEMILRDYLALDRTKLANERTLLAYLRTAIGLAASAIGLIAIINLPWAHVLGIALLVSAPVCLFFGLSHFFKIKRKMDRIG
jgi:putative membrane protein